MFLTILTIATTMSGQAAPLKFAELFNLTDQGPYGGIIKHFYNISS